MKTKLCRVENPPVGKNEHDIDVIKYDNYSTKL